MTRALLADVAATGVEPGELGRVLARRLEPAGPRLLDDGRAEAALRAWQRLDVRVMVAGATSWPTRLDVLGGARPDLLAVRGDLAGLRRPTVGIVGQRRATPYGREVAAWLADGLARAGVTVVSGGAVGIDAAAHLGALDAGAPTVVVLGCGHDVDYPRPHARPGGLFDRVREGGGALVSELLPGDRPHPPRVLARNRLVAALSDALVVVEGGHRSGALNTSTHAAELGVPVLAVPGDVRAPGSVAPNRLLAEGCAPCREPADVLAVLGADLAPADPHEPSDDRGSVLPAAALGVLASAFPRPVHLDDLARQSGLSTGTLLAALTQARIAGVVVSDASGVRLQRRAR